MMSKKPHDVVPKVEPSEAPGQLPAHLRESRDEMREALDTILKLWDQVRAENHRLRNELQSK